MSYDDRLLSVREIGFDRSGRPVHCGVQMDDDYDMWSCRRCSHYVEAYDVTNERARRERQLY